MSLRDDIAARLRKIAGDHMDRLHATWKTDKAQMPARAFVSVWNEIYRDQADEVIRLMEWSRSDWSRELDAGRSNKIVTPALEHFPLTLPPEDWKP